MFEKHMQNAYTIHLCKQGEEFQKVLDFAGLFRPIVEAGIKGKWKILGVTSIGPREVFVDIEEVPASLAIAVGTPVARCPPHRPGRALISASGSYLG
jgi:hypothetical protein